MNWLIWRQHRKQWFVFLGILVIFAVIAVPKSIEFWHDYQQLSAACAPTNSCNPNELRNAIFNTKLDDIVLNGVKLSLLAMPFLLGLFWGAPLLAKEYADKTNKLIWTQGISRKKWLTTKLAWIMAATILYVGVASAIATWFSRTVNTVGSDRFEILAFSTQGIAPVAFAVFAVAVGTLFGTWFRKTLPAIGATLALLISAQVAVPLFLRAHYTSPDVYTSNSLISSDNGDPFVQQLPHQEGAWVVSEKMVNKNGQTFEWTNPPKDCKVDDPAAKRENGVRKADDGEGRHPVMGQNGVFLDVYCLDKLGYHWENKYHPSYRYWNFQRIEAGLYVALALVALGGTYALVLKRDA